MAQKCKDRAKSISFTPPAPPHARTEWRHEPLPPTDRQDLQPCRRFAALGL